LRGRLPMCAHCRKVRADEGLWTRLEAYLLEHADTRFSHGLRPDCLRELYPEDAQLIMEEMNPPKEG